MFVLLLKLLHSFSTFQLCGVQARRLSVATMKCCDTELSRLRKEADVRSCTRVWKVSFNLFFEVVANL